MNIPNDKGGQWRIDKFVEYQHFVPPVQYGIFEGYAEKRKLSVNEQIWLAYLMANTYQEISSIFLFEEIEFKKNYEKNFDSFFKEHNEKIILGSAKKHMRYNGRLEDTIFSFNRLFGTDPESVIRKAVKDGKTPLERTKLLKEQFKDVKHIGRFALDYIVEHIILFQKLGHNDFDFGEEFELDFVNGQNQTSALFNLLYEDDLADEYDRGKLSKKEIEDWSEKFVETIKLISDKIVERYGKRVETTFFITKLCSFRNLFKNERYGGFHHDRQLGYILKYIEDWPEHKDFFEQFFKIREEKFSHNLLGEKNGWTGIRKERKRIWTEYGYTGVEPESNFVHLGKKKTEKQTKSFCTLNDF